MRDYIALALTVGLIAVGIGIVCLGYVAWQNAGSRNLVLATATVGASLLLFGIQLPFELRSPLELTQFITAEFTVDRAKPAIRQWDYPSLHVTMRLPHEQAASDLFFKANPGQFDGDRAKLTEDMTLFSILAYFGTQQPDWQMKRVRYKGHTVGTMTMASSVSKPDECSDFSETQIAEMMRKAGNVFADANIFFGMRRLCLPPDSTLAITANTVVIENPFCRMSFTLEPSGSVMFINPDSRSLDERSKLPNGEGRYETRWTGIRVEVTYSAIRAQHREMLKYQDWAKRVVDGAQEWFES